MMRTAPVQKVAVALVMTSLLAFASSTNAQQQGSRPTREYIQAAASSDQFEILAADTALGQSNDAKVRAFATQMLQDHQRLAIAVREAAASSGLKPPEMAMSADQAQLLAALQGVKGPDFDALYFKQQSLAHHQALVVEQMYAKSGDDPGLRQLAISAIPVISSHVDMADREAKRLNSN